MLSRRNATIPAWGSGGSHTPAGHMLREDNISWGVGRFTLSQATGSGVDRPHCAVHCAKGAISIAINAVHTRVLSAAGEVPRKVLSF